MQDQLKKSFECAENAFKSMSKLFNQTEEKESEKKPRVGKYVNCTVCKRQKKPIGRDAAAAMANGLCDRECEGYNMPPLADYLWPGEKEEELYPRTLPKQI